MPLYAVCGMRITQLALVPRVALYAECGVRRAVRIPRRLSLPWNVRRQDRPRAALLAFPAPGRAGPEAALCGARDTRTVGTDRATQGGKGKPRRTSRAGVDTGTVSPVAATIAAHRRCGGGVGGRGRVSPPWSTGWYRRLPGLPR